VARRELPRGLPTSLSGDEDRRLLQIQRGGFELLCNFGSEELVVPCPDRDQIRLATSEQTRIERGGLRLAPLSGALIR
jgi:hypothetical protein